MKKEQLKYRCVISNCPRHCEFTDDMRQMNRDAHTSLCVRYPHYYFIAGIREDYEVSEEIHKTFMEMFKELLWLEEHQKALEDKENRDWLDDEVLKLIPGEIIGVRGCLGRMVSLMVITAVKKND